MLGNAHPFEALVNVGAHDLLKRGIICIAEFFAVSTVDGTRALPKWCLVLSRQALLIFLTDCDLPISIAT